MIHPRIHVPHVPNLPHPDLRHLARDVVVAAEVVLASVALTGSAVVGHGLVDGADDATAGRTVAAVESPAGASDAVAGSVVVAHIDLRQDQTGVIADVHLPADGTVSVRVVDAAGTVVQTFSVADATSVPVELPPGTYRVLATQEGPVVRVGDAVVSSSSVVRSDVLVFEHAGRVTVRVHLAG